MLNMKHGRTTSPSPNERAMQMFSIKDYSTGRLRRRSGQTSAVAAWAEVKVPPENSGQPFKRGFLSADERRASEPFAQEQARALVSGREEPVMANFTEARRQYVHHEAAQEFFRCQRHDLLLVAVAVIAPAEGDESVFRTDEPLVGNSDSMSVTAQIIDDLLRAAERRLAVDDPSRIVQFADQGAETLCIVQMLQAASKLKALPAQKVQQLPPEFTGQDFYGDEELLPAVFPGIHIGQPAAGDDTMQMGMIG